MFENETIFLVKILGSICKINTKTLRFDGKFQFLEFDIFDIFFVKFFWLLQKLKQTLQFDGKFQLLEFDDFFS